MKTVKLSTLESLQGGLPIEVYNLAKKLKYRVMILTDILPEVFFYKTLYFRVDDDDLVQSVWCHENHIEFDSL